VMLRCGGLRGWSRKWRPAQLGQPDGHRDRSLDQLHTASTPSTPQNASWSGGGTVTRPTTGSRTENFSACPICLDVSR
jgi:hypothetical protein